MQNYHNLTEEVVLEQNDVIWQYEMFHLTYVCDNMMNLANQNAISISGNKFILLIICCVIVMLMLLDPSLTHS